MVSRNVRPSIGTSSCCLIELKRKVYDDTIREAILIALKLQKKCIHMSWCQEKAEKKGKNRHSYRQECISLVSRRRRPANRP
jgi:predicted nucleotide-binding protein